MVKLRSFHIGGSSNGRTADSESACRGSNPLPPAEKTHHMGFFINEKNASDPFVRLWKRIGEHKQ